MIQIAVVAAFYQGRRFVAYQNEHANVFFSRDILWLASSTHAHNYIYTYIWILLGVYLYVDVYSMILWCIFFDLCIYIESSFQSHHFFQDHLTCFLPGTLALDVFHHALQHFGPRSLAVKSFASNFPPVSWCFLPFGRCCATPFAGKGSSSWTYLGSQAPWPRGWMDVIRTLDCDIWEEPVTSNILKNPLLKFFSPFLLLNV